MRSQLYFNANDPQVNLARWQTLAQKRHEFETAYGGTVIFDDLPTRKGCRIAVETSSGESIDDEDSWPSHLAWFRDTQVRLRTAVAAVGGIPGIPEGLSADEADDPDMTDGLT